MKIQLIILVFILTTLFAYCQTDTSIQNVLNKPIKNCEVIAFNSQELISKISLKNLDSLQTILKQWELGCGRLEPICRLQILLEIIQNTFKDSMCLEYINSYYIERHQERILAAKEKNYKDIYEQYKGYFSYVPLNGSFDLQTRKIAKELLPSKKLGSTEYFICLLFSDSLETYEKEVESVKYSYNFLSKKIDERDKNNLKKILNFSVFSGIWRTIGSKSDFYKTGFNLGFQGGFYFFNKFHFDLYLIFKEFGSRERIDIIRNDTVYNVKSVTTIDFGVSATRVFNIKDRFYIDFIIGVGGSSLFSDLVVPSTANKNQPDHETVRCINVIAGTTLRKIVFKRSSIGINAFYHYTPYNNDRRLKSTLDAQLFTLGLIWCL